MQQRFFIWQRSLGKMKLHYINPKEIFILSLQEQRPGTWIQSLVQNTINRNWHTDMVTHPRTNQDRCCLTLVYQVVDCSSMPITTDKYRVNSNICWLGKKNIWKEQMFWHICTYTSQNNEYFFMNVHIALKYLIIYNIWS